MIQRISHTGIYVLDQDAARDFYVDKLGFEVRDDQTIDNGFRWLTVGPKTQPDLNLILMKVDGPNIKPDVAVYSVSGWMDGGAMSCRPTRSCTRCAPSMSVSVTVSVSFAHW